MEIAPSTIIRLYSGVPLDNTYTDTLYFPSVGVQTAYFGGLTYVKQFTQNMYQRVNKGQFEANCRADDIYNCNYMAFQNAGYGNKWFYAFITKIEYINNNNSLVSFEIDVMQTWMFDYDLKQCYIERQHSVTDVIGGNILPENVELGEYVFEVNNGVYDTTLPYQQLFPSLNTYAICVMVSEPWTEEEWTWGNVFDNVYSGCYIYAVSANSVNASVNIRTLITQFAQKPEAILNMYMCPLYLLPWASSYKGNTYATIEDYYTYLHPVPSGQPNSTFTYTGDAPDSDDTFGNYIPKNKKMYTYPYNFFHVDNGDGDSLNLRYEFFTDNRPQLEVEGCLTTPIEVRLTPFNYKGVPRQQGTVQNPSWVENRAEFLTVSSFPICSWNYDTYRAWVAQNSIPMALQTVTGIGQQVMYGHGGIGAGILGQTSNILAQHYRASLMADTCKGNYNSGNTNFANRKNTFYGGRCHITKDYARAIDNYFTMYGYAYNKYGIPNISSRPHWNYTKTIGCKIVGRCPADDIKKICSIYDNGIRFWKSASEVGDYTLDNSPGAQTP